MALIKIYSNDPILWLPNFPSPDGTTLYEYKGTGEVISEKRNRYSQLKTDIQIMIGGLYQLERAYIKSISNHCGISRSFPTSINSQSEHLKVIQKYLMFIQNKLFITCKDNFKDKIDVVGSGIIEEEQKKLSQAVKTLEIILELKPLEQDTAEILKKFYDENIKQISLEA